MHDRILLNFSNIRTGGGLQVAISFLTELNAQQLSRCYDVFLSSAVAEAIPSKVFQNSNLKITIFDSIGIKGLFSKFSFSQAQYHVSFTLFGPKYTLTRSKNEIVGFAQPWISTPNNPLYKQMRFIDRLVTRFKFDIQSLFFRRSDRLVVELDHVKNGLAKHHLLGKIPVTVVKNALSSLYYDKDVWCEIEDIKVHKGLKLGLIARDYPHKNIAVLGDVAKLLNDHYGINVRFYLTLNSDEWKYHKEKFGVYGISVGPLSVYQCPRFYELMDGIVFPSLLECFSATPLETLFMGKPLFASDRGFVRDVCGEHALYFDPIDPHSIAAVIASFFLGATHDFELVEDAAKHVQHFSTAPQRALDYISIIESVLERK
jgi:glycosyltransferase involved in cell wall biosynthesis